MCYGVTVKLLMHSCPSAFPSVALGANMFIEPHTGSTQLPR